MSEKETNYDAIRDYYRSQREGTFETPKKDEAHIINIEPGRKRSRDWEDPRDPRGTRLDNAHRTGPGTRSTKPPSTEE